MKSQSTPIMKNYILPLLFIILLSILISSCGISSAINSLSEVLDRRTQEAVHSLDNAIATLAQESADWQVIVTNLEKEITEDVQSTIRNEIQNLTHSAIHSAGAEFRCNAEYMRIKLRRELIDIRNTLVQSINAELENTIFSSYQLPLLPQDPELPYICDVVPSAIDLNLEKERRSKIDIYGFNFKASSITVSYRAQGMFKPYVNNLSMTGYSLALTDSSIVSRSAELIKTNNFEILKPSSIFVNDISNALSIISDFHAVLDLTGTVVEIPPNANTIVLSWDNKIQSEVPVFAVGETLKCTTFEKKINPGTVTFTPPAVEVSPYGGHPDKEFDGNGPCVNFQVWLNLDASRKVLTAELYMNAWECPDDYSKIHEDYTQAKGDKTITLYTAADDETILSYDVQNYLFDKYIDTNTSPDLRFYGGTSAIDKIEFIGDTSGDEAGTKTSATVTFKVITLKLQKCEYE